MRIMRMSTKRKTLQIYKYKLKLNVINIVFILWEYANEKILLSTIFIFCRHTCLQFLYF